MSIQALNWSLDRSELKSTGAKFVLLVLCNYADENGFCYPSRENIASKTGMSVRAVQNHLNFLETAGYITTQNRKDARQKIKTNLYEINFKKPSADFAQGSKPSADFDKKPSADFDKKDKKPSADSAPYTKDYKDLNKRDYTKGNLTGDGVSYAGETAPSPFALIANFCFMVPIEKADFVGSSQKAKIDETVLRLESMEADLSALPRFLDYWRNDWRSLDLKYQKYQEPRPEQIADFWFMFYLSEGETARRLELEKQFETEKEIKKNGNRNGNGNRNDDFSNFDEIEFDQ